MSDFETSPPMGTYVASGITQGLNNFLDGIQSARANAQAAQQRQSMIDLRKAQMQMEMAKVQKEMAPVDINLQHLNTLRQLVNNGIMPESTANKLSAQVGQNLLSNLDSPGKIAMTQQAIARKHAPAPQPNYGLFTGQGQQSPSDQIGDLQGPQVPDESQGGASSATAGMTQDDPSHIQFSPQELGLAEKVLSSDSAQRLLGIKGQQAIDLDNVQTMNQQQLDAANAQHKQALLALQNRQKQLDNQSRISQAQIAAQSRNHAADQGVNRARVAGSLGVQKAQVQGNTAVTTHSIDADSRGYVADQGVMKSQIGADSKDYATDGAVERAQIGQDTVGIRSQGNLANTALKNQGTLSNTALKNRGALSNTALKNKGMLDNTNAKTDGAMDVQVLRNDQAGENNDSREKVATGNQKAGITKAQLMANRARGSGAGGAGRGAAAPKVDNTDLKATLAGIQQVQKAKQALTKGGIIPPTDNSIAPMWNKLDQQEQQWTGRYQAQTGKDFYSQKPVQGAAAGGGEGAGEGGGGEDDIINTVIPGPAKIFDWSEKDKVPVGGWLRTPKGDVHRVIAPGRVYPKPAQFRK